MLTAFNNCFFGAKGNLSAKDCFQFSHCFFSKNFLISFFSIVRDDFFLLERFWKSPSIRCSVKWTYTRVMPRISTSDRPSHCKWTITALVDFICLIWTTSTTRTNSASIWLRKIGAIDWPLSWFTWRTSRPVGPPCFPGWTWPCTRKRAPRRFGTICTGMEAGNTRTSSLGVSGVGGE